MPIPNEDYESCFRFVWCVWAFNFDIWSPQVFKGFVFLLYPYLGHFYLLCLFDCSQIVDNIMEFDATVIQCLYQARNKTVVIHSFDAFYLLILSFDYGLSVLKFLRSSVFFVILFFTWNRRLMKIILIMLALKGFLGKLYMGTRLRLIRRL